MGDPCLRVRRGPINSPKAGVITGLTVGSVLTVAVQMAGSAPILVVQDAGGMVAGSLTFIGYLEIVDCIRSRGMAYRAVVVAIAGGVVEVRVEPV